MKKSKGRPTKCDQARIKKAIFNLRDSGMDEPYIIKTTGHDKKTVYKYCKIRDEQTSEITDHNTAAKIKRESSRVKLGYDGEIVSYQEFLDEVDENISTYKADNKTVPFHLLDLKFNIKKFISTLKEKKWAFSLRPPIDESLNGREGSDVNRR